MKLVKLVTVVSLSMFFTTGCIASTESPEELAKIPIYNEEKKDMYEGIDKLLISSSLLLPLNSKDVGKINEVDLDNDGVNEIVAFEKKDSSNLEEGKVGFIVLKQNTSYKDELRYSESSNILENGEYIEYANFYDLDSDGNKEIILLIKNGENINMHIYKYEKNDIVKFYTLKSDWIPKSEDFTSMKIKIGYMDEDPKIDILMIHLNPKTNESYVSLANFDDELILKDFVKIENVKNLSDLYITIGNIATSKRGIILDIPTSKENNYMTQILYMENNKLHKAFNEYDLNLMKAYYIPVEDINNDKVIDIPIVNGNGHAYTSKKSANISWYKWNGKKEEQSSGLLFISQVYYNYQYNYKLLIPNNLVNKINIETGESSDHISFNFNYYDSITTQPKNLFTISLMNKVITDENKNINSKVGTPLIESEEYNFVLYLNDLEELKKLDITSDALVGYFSLIY
ncbi:MAG: hypothetical protein RRZ84_03940 [Romboutsia sp.]